MTLVEQQTRYGVVIHLLEVQEQQGLLMDGSIESLRKALDDVEGYESFCGDHKIETKISGLRDTIEEQLAMLREKVKEVDKAYEATEMEEYNLRFAEGVLCVCHSETDCAEAQPTLKVDAILDLFTVLVVFPDGSEFSCEGTEMRVQDETSAEWERVDLPDYAGRHAVSAAIKRLKSA